MATPNYDNAYWINQSQGKASGQYDDFVRNVGGGKDSAQLSKALNQPNISDYYGLLYARSNGVPGSTDAYNSLLASKKPAPAPAAPPPPPYGGFQPTPYTPFDYSYQPLNLQQPTPQSQSAMNVPMGGYRGSLPGQGMDQGMNSQGGGLLSGMLNKSSFLPHF